MNRHEACFPSTLVVAALAGEPFVTSRRLL
jgi:hypothetical protein